MLRCWFSLHLPFGFAIVASSSMVIVPLSGQSIDCRPNAIVCGCKEVRGTFMLDFHIGGLIVSCG